jgi:hypothetical protein
MKVFGGDLSRVDYANPAAGELRVKDHFGED